MQKLSLFNPQPGPSRVGEPTVNQLVDAFLRDQLQELAPSTFADRRRVCLRFAAEFGEQFPSKIFPSDVKAWIQTNPRWKQLNTRWGVANVLKRLFNWSVSDRRIAEQENPVKYLRLPKGGRRHADTEEEFRQMVRCSPGYFRRPIYFLRWVGCRPGDMMAVRWEWIHWRAKVPYLQIPPEAHKTGRATGKPAYLVLIPRAVRLLLWLQRNWPGSAPRGPAGPTGPIFLNSRDQPWSRIAVTKQLSYMRARSVPNLFGWPRGPVLTKSVTLHGLRHLVATTALRRGAHLKHVSQGLNHASSAITEEFYLHLGEDEDFSEIAEAVKLGSAPAPAPKKPGQ